MKLGDLGRRVVNGRELSFYLDALKEVRDPHACRTQRAGTMTGSWRVDEKLVFGGPTNNLCKWFHVCEHESHHLGQIELHLKSIRAKTTAVP